MEDPSMRMDVYRQFLQAAKEVERERAAYNKTMSGNGKKATNNEVTYSDVLDQDDMKDDQAMRARFEEWTKEYGRTYLDEEEKARRFKIFKSVARFADVTATVANELAIFF
jgi:uncharacterized protein with gpF-like domain